jgi:hypothetical protein
MNDPSETIRRAQAALRSAAHDDQLAVPSAAVDAPAAWDGEARPAPPDAGPGAVPDLLGGVASRTISRRRCLTSAMLAAAGLALSSTLVHNALGQIVGADMGILCVDTIAALKALNTGTLGTDTSNNTVLVLGYVAAGDGGGGLFKFNSGSAVADDGGGVIAPNAGAGRWLRQILDEEISVQQWGARGDGSTDDTARIQAAINYANANNVPNVFFPGLAAAGFYRITNTLTVPTRVRLFGVGYASAIKMTATSGSAPNVTSPNAIGVTGSFVTIEDLRIMGSNVVGGYAPTVTPGASSCGIAIAGDTIEKVTVRGCTIHAHIIYGVYAQAKGDVTIANNILFENNGTKSADIAVQGNATSNVALDRVKIIENFCLSNSNLGIDLSPGLNTLARDVLVNANHVITLSAGVAVTATNCLRLHGICAASSGTDAGDNVDNRVVITDNLIRFADSSGIFVSDGTAGLPVGPFVITGNYISDVGLNTADTNAAGISLIGNGKGDIVSGNRIERSSGSNAHGIRLTNAASTSDDKSALIAANYITDTAHGIFLGGQAHNVHVTNNNVMDARLSSIVFSLNAGSTIEHKVLIAGNKLYQTVATSPGIDVNQQNSTGVVKIEGNYLYGPGTANTAVTNTAINCNQRYVIVTNNYVKAFYRGVRVVPTITVRDTTIQVDRNFFQTVNTAIDITRGANTTGLVLCEGNTFDGVTTRAGNAVSLGERNDLFYVTYGTAIPTAGTWSAGDRVLHSNPATGQPMGWVRTGAGTWNSLGNLT